jgi:hypothetical protein
MPKNSLRCLIIFAAVILVGSVGRVLAQTDPELLVKPWQPGQFFDTSTEGVIESSGPTQEDHQQVGLSSVHAQGRLWVLPDQRASPRLGYDLLYFDIRGGDAALPRHLVNGTVGFAQPVAEINKYFVVVTGAVGYAGESPFSDPHAQYFTGNLIVGREFSKDRAIVVALNYDGNRTFLPDVPIPALEYTDRYNPQLTYVIGAPLDTITYEPVSGLQVVGGLELLQTFIGRVGYEFDKHFAVVASYTDRLTAFHLSNLPADRRLFLQEHRAEVGFRWNPTNLIRVTAGGGWAFGQEFATGFDDRGQNPIRHLRDAPFAELNVEIGF